MPIYWFTVIVYPIWDITIENGNIINNIILIPIELLGIQNTFHSLFGYTHNGGTWFVSCILFSYLIFPFLYNWIKEFTIKKKFILTLLLYFIILYSPFVVDYLGIEGLYSNLFFRILEFITGMLICSIYLNIKEKKWYKLCAQKILFGGILCILIIGVTTLVKRNIWIGNYMKYNVIALPCFSLLVLLGAGIKTPHMNASRIVKYAVNISYAFFFAQFYAWKITLGIIKVIGIETNITKITISFIICILIAVIMHEAIEKPIKRCHLSNHSRL